PRSREEKTFAPDAFRRELSPLDLGRIQPEGSSLCLDHVANDQPFQFGESFALQPTVGSANGRVLTHDKQSLHFSVRHIQPVAELTVISSDARQPVEAVIVFFGGSIAVVSLHEADEIFVEARPHASASFMLLNVLLYLVRIRFAERHRQVSRNKLVSQ